MLVYMEKTDVDDGLEPFNPNNPKHLKGIEKWVEKTNKKISKHPEGLLIPSDLCKGLFKR